MMAWDIKRREFLGAGALGATVAGLGVLPGAASARARRVTVIEETASPESRMFAATLAESGVVGRTIRLDRSLNVLLHGLDDTDGLVVGLTSDPAAMIAGQVLVARGARPALLWRHHYTGGRWQHRTEGAAQLLQGAAAAWPVAVAHLVRDALGAPTEARLNTCQSGSCDIAASSPGLLASWVYEIGGDLS